MILAENIVSAYRSRHKSTNWAAWVEENQVMAKILFEIEKEIAE